MDSHKKYPIIAYPNELQEIMFGMPRIPNEPTFLEKKPILEEFDPEPILVLGAEPKKPFHIRLLEDKYPEKIFINSRIMFSIFFLAVMLGILIGNYLNPLGGLAFTALITISSMYLRNTESNYYRKLEQWKIDGRKIEEDYQQKIIQWQVKNRKKEQLHWKSIREWEEKYLKYQSEYQEWENEREKMYSDPIKLTELRVSQLKQQLRKLEVDNNLKSNESDSFHSRGFAEYPKNCQFPILIAKYFSGKIHNLVGQTLIQSLGSYTPDFIYEDTENNLFIDIEIDEPYTPRQYRNSDELKIIHYLGYDDERNKYFTSGNWIVVRFSEFQVLCYPDKCCHYLAQLIYLMTEDKTILARFTDDLELPLDEIWTQHKGEIMANNQGRLNYHCGAKSYGTTSLLPKGFGSTLQDAAIATI